MGCFRIVHIQKLEDNTILLTAPVMIPGRPDCDIKRGEPPLTVGQVKNFKESFEKYKFIDSEHELVRTGKYRGFKKESVLLTEPTSLELYDGSTETYPEGTWLLTGHITDPDTILAAEKGEYTGWSPSVRSRETADKYFELIQEGYFREAESLKSQSLSGLIKDVPDPVVLSVSLVRKPCQTGSKLCKLKNNGVKMTDENVKTKVLKALGMSDEADVEALKGQVETLEDKIEELKSDNAEALKSLKEELVSEFKEALVEFADKSKKDEENESEEDEEETEETSEDETSTENSNEETTEDEDEEEDDKKKGSADKGSKQGKVHNGSDKGQTDVTVDTYEFLGRYPDGTRKKQ